MTQTGDSRPRGGGAIHEIVRRLDTLLRAVEATPESSAPLYPPAHDAVAAARTALRNLDVKERVFGPMLAGDASWRILLQLFLAQAEGENVTVEAACASAATSESASLRCIASLIEAGLVTRPWQDDDAQAARIGITARGCAMMCDYFNRAADRGDADA